MGAIFSCLSNICASIASCIQGAINAVAGCLSDGVGPEASEEFDTLVRISCKYCNREIDEMKKSLYKQMGTITNVTVDVCHCMKQTKQHKPHLAEGHSFCIVMFRLRSL
ncbi:hypothetical protein WJX79_005098 [Trebouxia sp. C0005]